MAEILVLGAGFGGLTTATELRRRLPAAHRITLVEQRTHYVMGLAKLWAMDGRRPLASGRRDLELVRARNVNVVHGRVEKMDTAARKVWVGTEALDYDHLIVALGAELAPEATPGFEGAHNLYSEEGVERLAKTLSSFAKGRLVVAIAAMPFKCPPAPYEAALLLDALLRRRGIRDAVTLELTTPEPHPLPVAPAHYGERVANLLKAHRIEYAPAHKPTRIHASPGEVEYENGARKPFDVLVGVPVHRAPTVVRDAGLTDASGWIPVDPSTLGTGTPHVFAIGDVATMKLANGKPLPKAGVLAEEQARVVAANLADELQGRRPTAAFTGVGTCYLEVGGGKAMEAQGEFFARPEPRFTFHDATAASLRAKERFEADRLRAWFGA